MGYSGTPLINKLGIKPGARCLLLNAPRGFGKTLGPLPPGATLISGAARNIDVVLLFVRREAEMHRRMRPLAARLAPAGMIWIAWPKKASGVATDLAFDVVQKGGLSFGLVDTKICAIDDIWSGLRFVVRLKDRMAPSGSAAPRRRR
jgi:hypothetical protein